MPRLARTLRTGDGLAVVVGIMVGSGIFRTPGTVAALLGRPGLTFVAWALGGAVGFLGALIFAELSTRYPQAGGNSPRRLCGFGEHWAHPGCMPAGSDRCALLPRLAANPGLQPFGPRGHEPWVLLCVPGGGA